MSTYKVGKLGEKMAEKYLRKEGYTIIEKNFHSAYGEIDLIAVRKDYIIFIEVKLRSNKQYGDIRYTINSTKQNKLIKTAYLFLSQNNKYKNFNMRFDAVFIKKNKKEKYDISLMKNIFFIDNNIKGFY